MRFGGTNRSDAINFIRQLEVQGVELDDRDKEPDCDPYARMLIGWWTEIAPWRAYGAMGGPAPITLEDVKTWAELTGRYVGPWHLEQLRLIDDIFLIAYSGKDNG